MEALSWSLLLGVQCQLRPGAMPTLTCAQQMLMLLAAPCESLFSNHPAIISVAASDGYDQATEFGPHNSSCIDIWAPSGGVGSGMVGASPKTNSSYVRVITK